MRSASMVAIGQRLQGRADVAALRLDGRRLAVALRRARPAVVVGEPGEAVARHPAEPSQAAAARGTAAPRHVHQRRMRPRPGRRHHCAVQRGVAALERDLRFRRGRRTRRAGAFLEMEFDRRLAIAHRADQLAVRRVDVDGGGAVVRVKGQPPVLSGRDGDGTAAAEVEPILVRERDARRVVHHGDGAMHPLHGRPAHVGAAPVALDGEGRSAQQRLVPQREAPERWRGTGKAANVASQMGS